MEHKKADPGAESLTVTIEAGKSFLGKALHGITITHPGTCAKLTVRTQLESVQPALHL